jgi:hypothetical protein
MLRDAGIINPARSRGRVNQSSTPAAWRRSLRHE